MKILKIYHIRFIFFLLNQFLFFSNLIENYIFFGYKFFNYLLLK